MSQLIGLHFSNNELSGSIPSQLANLGQLDRLSFAVNELSGYIPSWFSNMTELTVLNLAFNKLQGPIPSWITEVPSLSMLHLGWNQFNGMELNLNSSTAEINRQDYGVGLASCNLREFPSFLQSHPGLVWLDLSHNNIQGEVPSWMHGIGIDTLYFLNISNNYLTGFDPTLDYLPWNALMILDLSSNMFLGYPPVPSPSAKMKFYLVSNNNLTGEFPSGICNWSSLIAVDLSFNNLTGSLPDCLGNISFSLTVMNLQQNAFTGNVPQLYVSGSQLAMIALGHNHLLGRLPKSLANCSNLEFIDFGNNYLEDTFPSWLGSLAELRVLILSHNKFHGDIPGSLSGFKGLRIIDLSHNQFNGMLPAQIFQTLISMTVRGPVSGRLSYLRTSIFQPAYLSFVYYSFYDFYMTLANKGLKLYYPKVTEIFTSINLSGNKFEGGIPDVIGNLKQLNSLNLSNNFLICRIPSSMGNMSQLESLDLSLNKLSGEIPRQLAELNFLSFLNMSYNNVLGEIPRGTQLGTFHDISFQGNPGLCDDAISKKCRRSQAETPPKSSLNMAEDSEWFIEWKVVLMGYCGGLFIGVVIGCVFDPHRHGWFLEIVQRMQQKRQRRCTRRGRN